MSWRGFTLVEVLVALAILTVVLGVLASSFGSSLRMARESRQNAVATEYAQAVAELYRTHWSVPANFIAGTSPDLSALNARLTAMGFSATVDATARLNPDGTAFTSSGQPPLRRVVISVFRGSELRTRLVVDVGNPNSSALR